MTKPSPASIQELQERLRLLQEKQDDFAQEISAIREELRNLANNSREEKETATVLSDTPSFSPPPIQLSPLAVEQPETPSTRKPNNWERFIGENLLSKIGILILIIGVAIGAKYAIDNEFIGPVGRIVLGYLSSIILLLLGMKLKRKYENYSAVLVSGAVAIMYFITYLAHTLYALFPQVLAFVLMVAFTGFAVLAALRYSRQVIAIIGLVGGYAVPFLLSDDSGNPLILLSYMSLINGGILLVASNRYWRGLQASAFGITWLILLLWILLQYKSSDGVLLAMSFLTLHFLMFYLSLLNYKLKNRQQFVKLDVVLLLSNTFIYYTLGFYVLDGELATEPFLALFTLAVALVHLLANFFTRRKKTADKSIYYLTLGLVFTFLAVAAVVQFDGSWVSLFWAAEGALLFWIGRTRGVAFYEKMGFPLLFLSFFSLLHDWGKCYGHYSKDSSQQLVFMFNSTFAHSLLLVAVFAFVCRLYFHKKYPSVIPSQHRLMRLLNFAMPALLIITLYFSFYLEIVQYLEQQHFLSERTATSAHGLTRFFWNEDYRLLKVGYLLAYSLLFISLLFVVNLRKIKSRSFSLINLILAVIVLLSFLTTGLYALSELRGNYLAPNELGHYTPQLINLWLRYPLFLALAWLLVVCRKQIAVHFAQRRYLLAFEFALHIIILWVLSSELLHWLDIAGTAHAYKLGLSILWGSYSFLLVGIGIWRKNKSLRIGAIGLFAITLLKLFVYDISHLGTISKTIVFVSLGVLLLAISFLYTKYKRLIFEDDESD